MSRVAAPIHCNESDIKKLYAILNNDAASEDLKIRANIILLANDGLSSKEIAARLEIRENTVSDWRKRYLADGVDGLRDRERPGRRGKNGLNNRQAAAELAKEQNDVNVKRIQDQLHVSQSTVLRGFRDAGINPQGVNNLKVLSGTESKGIALEGLYLDADSEGIAIRVSKHIRPDAVDGFVRMEGHQAESPVALDDLLRSMTGDGSLRPAAGISLQGFLNHFIVRKSHEDEDDAQHVVIIHGEGIRFPGTTIPDNVYITRIPNKEMWLNILYTWTMALGRESSGYRIYNSIHEYVDQLTFNSKPFAWFGKAREEEPAQSADTVLTVSMSVRGKDGSLTETRMSFDNVMPTLEDASYSDKLAVGRYAGKVQEGIQQGITQTAASLMEKYMAAAFKKNTL